MESKKLFWQLPPDGRRSKVFWTPVAAAKVFYVHFVFVQSRIFFFSDFFEKS
jgi:hypothetical protein